MNGSGQIGTQRYFLISYFIRLLDTNTRLLFRRCGSYAPVLIWNARHPECPGADCIAPLHRFPGLKLKSPKDVAIAVIIHMSGKRLPARDKVVCALRAFIMRVINMLDYRLARMQN